MKVPPIEVTNQKYQKQLIPTQIALTSFQQRPNKPGTSHLHNLELEIGGGLNF